MASWDVVLSPPWAQQRRWIPMGFNNLHLSNQKLKDGGGLTLYAKQKKKALRAYKSMG